jgi:hypothetical protein
MWYFRTDNRSSILSLPKIFRNGKAIKKQQQKLHRIQTHVVAQVRLGRQRAML